MANFPGSVTSFAARSNGQVIDASHVQDLQNEVNAIEDGYLNGTARLNSSNSTVANLSVGGGSTFTGAAVFNGAVTINGALNGITPEIALVSGSSTPFANGSSAAITWPTHFAMTNSSMHSTAVNSERYFPQSTGYWVLSAGVKLQQPLSTGGSSASFTVSLEDSSGGIWDFQRIGAAGEKAPTIQMYGVKYVDTLSATPWLRLVGTQASGSTNSVDPSVSWLRFFKL